MHDQAMQWIAKHATTESVTVLDLGGRDVNGSPRDLWLNVAKYTVVDILPGDGVDFVADAATVDPGCLYDVAVCAETFEHTANWPAICRNAYKLLNPGGTFIVTTAGPGRPPHSAIDGLFRLHPGEHYANVPAAELERVLIESGFTGIVVDSQWSPNPCDTRAVATRPQYLTDLQWYYGPKHRSATGDEADPGSMWCYDCGNRVYALEDGYVCTGCNRQSEE